MTTKQEYLALITTEHSDRPKFMTMVGSSADVFVKLAETLSSLKIELDIDHASGAQLDQIGEWIGASRNLAVPIDGVYFAWGDTDAKGWNYGVWRGQSDPIGGIESLPDDVYRTLLMTKIAANQWNGTIDGAYDIWDQIFTGQNIVISDYQNMNIDITLIGGTLDTLTKKLLTNGYFKLKASGVSISNYYESPSTAFGWNVQSSLIDGWGVGSWASKIQ